LLEDNLVFKVKTQAFVTKFELNRLKVVNFPKNIIF